jgi:hypothetical protein
MSMPSHAIRKPGRGRPHSSFFRLGLCVEILPYVLSSVGGLINVKRKRQNFRPLEPIHPNEWGHTILYPTSNRPMQRKQHLHNMMLKVGGRGVPVLGMNRRRYRADWHRPYGTIVILGSGCIAKTSLQHIPPHARRVNRCSFLHPLNCLQTVYFTFFILADPMVVADVDIMVDQIKIGSNKGNTVSRSSRCYESEMKRPENETEGVTLR